MAGRVLVVNRVEEFFDAKDGGRRLDLDLKGARFDGFDGELAHKCSAEGVDGRAF